MTVCVVNQISCNTKYSKLFCVSTYRACSAFVYIWFISGQYIIHLKVNGNENKYYIFVEIENKGQIKQKP
jgi:hypothetical protein